MPPYRCILSVIPMHHQGEELARHALRIAQLHDAPLVIATVVDFDTGCETDHYPFHSPREVTAAMVREAEKNLARIAERLGNKHMACRVVAGYGRKPCLDLATGCGADLVIVDASTAHLLVPPPSWLPLFTPPPLPFDLLVLHAPSPGIFERVQHALANGFC